jgi:hypothetical protein
VIRDTLRTILPAYLYHEKCGTHEVRRSTKVNAELWERWEGVKTKLIGDEACLRLMIQYPVDSTASEKPGRVHYCDTSPCDTSPKDQQEKGGAQKRKYDWLATVSGDNSSKLFGGETLTALDILKRQSQKKGTQKE